MQHLHTRLYLARPKRECKNQLIDALGWNALGGRHDTVINSDFDGRYSESRVGMKEKMRQLIQTSDAVDETS